METKNISQGQQDICKKIDCLIKRFKDLDRELQQPWRNCGEDEKKRVQVEIEDLNDLFKNVENRKIENQPAEIVFGLTDAIANSIETELQYQNFLKSQGMDILPLGQLK